MIFTKQTLRPHQNNSTDLTPRSRNQYRGSSWTSAVEGGTTHCFPWWLMADVGPDTKDTISQCKQLHHAEIIFCSCLLLYLMPIYRDRYIRFTFFPPLLYFENNIVSHLALLTSFILPRLKSHQTKMAMANINSTPISWIFIPPTLSQWWQFGKNI